MRQINKHFFAVVVLLASNSCYAEASSNDVMQANVINGNSINDFRDRAQNPLSPQYSVPLNYVYHGGADNGGVSIGSIQPIIPVSLGSWNVINQLSLNFIDTSGGIQGIAQLPEPYAGSGAVGLGDTTFTSLFSPVSSDNVSWGFGPTFVFPTDTLFSDIEDRRSRQLGSGKFSIGPSAMIVTQSKPFTLGLNVKQIWSVLGNDSRRSVSQMELKPFVNYNLADGWYVLSDMDMVANWNRDNNQGWTVPVGGGVGKVVAVGKDAINIRAESYYNPIRPDQSPDWSANVTLQYLFAK
ncbi:MAG: hypothetical protein Q8N30_07710 [Methylococcales bacterium]|jgi:hypothetical protein|nr:hypothetical protein [Methylococcales bacterium]